MTMPTLLMQRAHDEVMTEDGPTLPDKPRRRTFTAEYKLAIVEAYDACAGDGDKGALLRRECLYSSHIVEWRRARDLAVRSGLAQTRRAMSVKDSHASNPTRISSRSCALSTAPAVLGPPTDRRSGGAGHHDRSVATTVGIRPTFSQAVSRTVVATVIGSHHEQSQ